jgi:hypothetical protein
MKTSYLVFAAIIIALLAGVGLSSSSPQAKWDKFKLAQHCKPMADTTQYSCDGGKFKKPDNVQ